MMFQMENETVRDWFLESFPSAPCGENFVSTVGSEPYMIGDFDDLMRAGGLEVFNIFDETDVLVIGREAWDEEELNTLLDRRDGKQLRVYSQEMFLGYWVSGRDPFEDEEVARAFGEGHPALEYLSSVGFDWPSTYVSLGDSSGFFADEELVKIGLLRHMGYRVGERGVEAPGRRLILEKVFKYRLPVTNLPGWYVEQWGSPKSRERLKKMADSLAAFYRREKKLGHEVAASDYEDDLEWLYENFYRGRFRFRWPQYAFDR